MMITYSIVLAIVTQMNALEGQVRDARSHARIAAAKVELNLAEVPLDRQYTNNDGRFHFGRLAGRIYTITVEHSEYEPSRVVFDTLNSSSHPVVIELVPKRRLPEQIPPVVSARDFLVPNRARKEFDRARQEAQRQNCPKAIVHFEKGLREFSEEASVHNELGNCYRKLEQLDRAEQSFRRAWDLGHSPHAALNLAEVYAVQKRFNEAELVLLAAIQKNPDAGDVYYGLSLIYAGQGLLDKARDTAHQAESRPHRVADLHFVLAELYCLQQNSAAVTRQLDLYLNEAPKGSRSEKVREALKDAAIRNTSPCVNQHIP